MKNNLQKRLKAEADEFTPDPLEKIKCAAREENLLPADEAYRQGNTAVKVKRTAATLLTAFAAFALCLALILTFILNKSPVVPDIPSRITLSASDAYGMGAVSTVKLLDASVSAGAPKLFTALSAEAEKSDKAKAQAEKFNEYFTALDSFLGEELVTTQTEINADERYPYENKMTISGKDFNGNVKTYTMYFTERLHKAETDGDEYENEYKLNGVMVIDGAEYFLEGERSEEAEKDETETELKIRAYADIGDKSSFVQMEQEFSREDGETENEYVYSVYSNGKLVEQTAVEFETKENDGITQTEYELEFRNGASKGKYKIERENKNGVTEIKVKYKIDGEDGTFRIREITDGSGNRYEYVFSDNSKLKF